MFILVKKMTPKEAEEKYGKLMLEKMIKTGFLDGITVTINKDGTMNVPQKDYDIAYKAVKYGKKSIHPYEWD